MMLLLLILKINVWSFCSQVQFINKNGNPVSTAIEKKKKLIQEILMSFSNELSINTGIQLFERWKILFEINDISNELMKDVIETICLTSLKKVFNLSSYLLKELSLIFFIKLKIKEFFEIFKITNNSNTKFHEDVKVLTYDAIKFNIDKMNNVNELKVLLANILKS